jgi:hypothetical protein
MRTVMKKYELKELQTEIKGVTPAERPNGSHARYLLLAYAFLRGIPYLALEKKVREHNEPYARALQKAAARFVPKTATEFAPDTSEAACEAWLRRPEAVVEAAPAIEVATGAVS